MSTKSRKSAKKTANKGGKKPIKKAVKKAAPKMAAKKSIVAKGRKKATFVQTKRNPYMYQDISDIVVTGASFLHDNVLLITFSDGAKREVDFSSFLDTTNIAYLKKYKTPELFKSFRIEDGNVVWGENLDLIFPTNKLYAGKI